MIAFGAMGASLVGGILAWPFTVDDAFILGRYARNLSSGVGYAMNPGPPTDGVTGPLGLIPGWLGSSWLGGWLGLDAVVASKVIGLLSAALAIALVADRLGRSRLAARSLPIALAAALVGPTLLVWSQGGLETGLACLAFTLAGLGALRPRGGWLWIGALGCLSLPWLRPELVPAAGILALGPLIAGRKPEGVKRWAALWMPLLMLGLGLASVTLFRAALFGHPLPLSSLAKPPLPQNGLPYVLRAILLWIGPAGVALLIWSARHLSRQRLLIGALIVHLLAVFLAGGDWMPGFRLMAPLSPLLAWLLGRSFARLSLRWSKGGQRARLKIGALALALAAPWILDAALQWPGLRASAEPRRERAGAILEALRPYDRVALVDVGYLAYQSGIEVIDLGGVTDPQIAALPGGHLDKAIPVELLQGRDPQAILLHSANRPRIHQGRLRSLAGYPVERRIARLPWLRERFEVQALFPYNPDYFYVLLAPRTTARRGGSGAQGSGDSVEAQDPDQRDE